MMCLPSSSRLLLGRLAVELFAVALRINAGMVDDAVSMIRRRVKRIQLQRHIAGTGFHAKELIERVDFGPMSS